VIEIADQPVRKADPRAAAMIRLGVRYRCSRQSPGVTIGPDGSTTSHDGRTICELQDVATGVFYIRTVGPYDDEKIAVDRALLLAETTPRPLTAQQQTDPILLKAAENAAKVTALTAELAETQRRLAELAPAVGTPAAAPPTVAPAKKPREVFTDLGKGSKT
jgi:hypothetical protein